MHNPIAVAREFLRVRPAALALLKTLKERGRPGGIDVTRQDAEGAAALMYLLKHNPEVTVVKNRKNLTLMMKSDVDLTFSPGVAKALRVNGHLATETEDLVAQVTPNDEKDAPNE